jgi:predicted RNA-binding Zn ribbon-like protein
VARSSGDATWMVDRTLPWLGYFPLAVDLANTVVVVNADTEVDLLSTEQELETWMTAGRRRFPVVAAAAGHLAEVRLLRDAVRDVLHAAAARRRLPAVATGVINAASARCPAYQVLDRAGRAQLTELNDGTFDRFCAAVARSAIDVASGAERERLAVCHAPSCGMFFLRGSARQTWCSALCGNRARVSRHAERVREAARR